MLRAVKCKRDGIAIPFFDNGRKYARAVPDAGLQFAMILNPVSTSTLFFTICHTGQTDSSDNWIAF